MKCLKNVASGFLILSGTFIFAQNSNSVTAPGIGNHPPARKGIAPKGVKGAIHGKVFYVKDTKSGQEDCIVSIKGTTLSTTTNNDGSFYLDITPFFDSHDELTVMCEAKNYSVYEQTIKSPFPRVTRLKIELVPKEK